MIKSDNTIPVKILDILRTCKGKKLEAILSTEKTDTDLSFILVILRFDDFDLELWALEKPYIEGELADLTGISVKINSDKNTKKPWGTEDKKGVFHPAKLEKVPVGQTVKDITVHNELVQWTYEDELFSPGKHVCDRLFPRDTVSAFYKRQLLDGYVEDCIQSVACPYATGM